MNSLEKYAAKKLLVTGLVKEAAWSNLARMAGRAAVGGSRRLPRFGGKVDVAGVGRNLNQSLVQRFAKSQAAKSTTPDRIAKVTRLERATTSPSTKGLYSTAAQRTPLANSMRNRLSRMKASMGGGMRNLPRQTQMVGKAQNLRKQFGALKKRVG